MLTQFPPGINKACLIISCNLVLRILNLSMQKKTHLQVYCNLYRQWAYALFYTDCKEKMRQEQHRVFEVFELLYRVCELFSLFLEPELVIRLEGSLAASI